VNQTRKPATDFEQRLLTQLRAVVAERGAAEAAPGVAGASATPPAWRRPSSRLALAGAGLLAAIVTAILLVSSGPTAEPAAAEVLRRTAAIAASAGGPSGIPGPGQFLYTKTKRLEPQEWVPGSYTGSLGGISPEPKGAFHAINTWQEEEWWSADGPSRSRWVMGPPRFFSDAEQARWEKAGSPLPGSFECDSRCFPGSHIIELRPGVTDIEEAEGPRFRDFSSLSTEPKALRLAIEQRQGAGPVNTGQVISELWDILDKPNTTAELRAAIFGALAELPGIELDRSASNLVGRTGYALSYESPDSSSGYGEQQPGLRVEYIFDPETSEILGRRELVTRPEQVPWPQGVAPGTVRREVAYLQSGVVDSTGERPDERNGEPVATTDPAYR
jgi:hypothetical protein